MSILSNTLRMLPWQRAERRAFLGYLGMTAFCIVFSTVYEIFSHQVYSTFLILAFLFPLLEMEKKPDDLAVIGVPVGFVNVVEAKQRLWDSGLDCIVALGRRGGSNVAAAIVNALMYGIAGVRP